MKNKNIPWDEVIEDPRTVEYPQKDAEITLEWYKNFGHLILPHEDHNLYIPQNLEEAVK